jgi:predicted dehydrogenase
MAQHKIGVGIIGIEPGRSWAAVAHLPALRALPEYEVRAVATRRRESAEAAASALGIPLAFGDPAALIGDSRVDLVIVAVKVPHHYQLVQAALAAGKHVYCEWPLGNGLDEAVAMAEQARRTGIACCVGLQARMAPVVDYVRELVGSGFVGEVLSTTLVGSGMQWANSVDAPNAYVVDKTNGATMLTIPMGHTLDALCHCLGEFRWLSAIAAIRQPSVTRTDTGETLAKTAEDQIVVAGELGSGAIASVHYRGGSSRGVKLLWEINGTEGDLQVTAEGGHAQIFDLSLAGARGEDRGLRPMAVPAAHRWVPETLAGPAVNVGQMYACFATDLRDGTRLCPDFDHAVRRHRMVAAIEDACRTGERVQLEVM